MKYDRLVLGYHGCRAGDADAILAGSDFRESNNDYDWLGPGVYFWEHGPDRALRFIRQKLQRKGSDAEPAVVGAIIQLGACFDLLDTKNTAALKHAYPLFEKYMKAFGQRLPTNTGRTTDLELRFLDCAMLTYYLKEADKEKVYQTVRGSFVEGGPAFPGSQLSAEAHIQIAVRRRSCIVGTFRPY